MMTLDTRLHQVIRMIPPLLLSLTLLTGCVSQVALTKSARESIRSVSINKDIKLPDDMYYQGLGQSVGMATGLIGMAVAQEAAQDHKAYLKAAMRDNQIDFPQIVREQFETALADAHIFPWIAMEGGDAEVRLEILSYGFIQASDFSSHLKPLLQVTGRLVRTDGTVLWQQYNYVGNMSGQTPAHTLEEYLRNPQFIREAITVAAQIVSDGLVKHIQQD